MRITGDQKRKIAELEYQISTEKVSHDTGDFSRQKTSVRSAPLDVNLSKSPSKCKKSLPEKKSKMEHKKTCCKKASAKETQTQKKEADVLQSVPPLMLAKCCCEAGGCLKSMKELLDKELDYRQAQVSNSLKTFQKDYNSRGQIFDYHQYFI